VGQFFLLTEFFKYFIFKALQAINPSFKFYSHGVYYEPMCNSTADSLDHGKLLNKENKQEFLIF
jgi:hypothetical protein